jgi:putative oxygen-independent coproporphyrinogen III oxidase
MKRDSGAAIQTEPRPHPGLYVHVPFCKRKCPYCDFYSIGTLDWVPPWLLGIDTEARLYADRFTPFDTLYLGGGTPSLLTDAQLIELLASLRRHFRFTTDVEFTVEANPDDLTPEKLGALRDLGVNRLSLGAQSFHERELQILRRRHSARQTERVLEWVRAAGYTNVGVDLMYGLPGQSQADWLKNLERAVAFGSEHLSCYQLTLAEHTPFGKMRASGQIEPLTEEQGRAFFLLTSQFLEEHGYSHYEISNFARGSQYISRHNNKYWQHVPYLGLGPGAHSFACGRRWWNLATVKGYCGRLADDTLPVAESETLGAAELWLETLALGLRTRSGLDLRMFQGHSDAIKVLNTLQQSGLVELRDDRVHPTRAGLVVADSLPLLFPNTCEQG